MSKTRKLKELEDELECCILGAKESYIAKLTSSFLAEPKKLYRYLKALSKPASARVFQGPSSEVLLDDNEIAVAFNAFFHSTFTTSSYVLPSTENLPVPSSQLSTIRFDSADVQKAVSKLDAGYGM